MRTCAIIHPLHLELETAVYFLPFKKSVKECIGLARKLLPAGLSQERIR
jgi:hypothetical protein